MTGKVATPKGYNPTTLPDQVSCGRISDGRGRRLFQPFDVGDSGVFCQVVVYIGSISKGKPSLAAALRFYTNQTVENPYIRYNITEDAQSAIVPTLDKQRYR